MGRMSLKGIFSGWRIYLAVAALSGLMVGSCSSQEDEKLPEMAERAIDLVEMQDLDGLVAVALTHDRPCSVSVEVSPRCEDGDADGTTYKVFPSAVCQGFWTKDVESNMQGVLNMAGEPFAVARLGTPPAWAQDPGPPYGTYVVIFSGLQGASVPGAVALYVDDDAIVRTQVGCRRADQFLEPGVDEEAPEVIWRSE